jgi:hypothetical protein
MSLEILRNLKVAKSLAEVDRFMMEDESNDPGCILGLENEWHPTSLALMGGQSKVQARIKPIAVMHQYNTRVNMKTGQSQEHSFELSKGISTTSSTSNELSVSMGVSIEGLFNFGMSATTTNTLSTTRSEETKYILKETLKGPIHFCLYQQVVLYATMVPKNGPVRAFLENANVTVYDKEHALYFITPAFRSQKPDSKPAEITTLTEAEFGDYLMGEAFDKWSTQPVGKLEGKRIVGDGSPAVYLVLDKKLRHIENPQVYDNLFGNNRQLQGELQGLVDNMPKGTPFTNSTPLVRGVDGKIYLIDDCKKRHIRSSEVFNKFGFDWNHVVNIDHEADKIPDGVTV